MPDRETMKRVRADQRQGKAASTQAGEFIREETHHIREGKHGARSTKQAVAIGLSKARRAGVKLKPPAEAKASKETRRKAELDLKHSRKRHTSAKRSRAINTALKREGHAAASARALSRQARTAAANRTKKSRSAAAKKAARTRARRRS